MVYITIIFSNKYKKEDFYEKIFINHYTNLIFTMIIII